MKKCIAILLTVAIVLGLCACGTSGNEETQSAAVEGFQAGYGIADITPDFSVPLAGYGNTQNRMSTNILDKIYITCIALTEGEDTVLLFSQDMIRTNDTWLETLRAKIETELGIPSDNVIVSSTHTHSSVDDRGQIGDYSTTWLNSAFAAAQDALADRAKASISSNSVETEDLTFVRHYIKEDGSYCGDGFGDKLTGAPIQDYATTANKEMLLVKFDREDESKDDILLMNFQAHPCMTANAGKDTNISADFVGFARQIIQEETDMKFIYFTGSAGNQNTMSYISEENDIMQVDKYAEKLAQYALDNLEGMTAVEGEGIKVIRNNYEYKVNKNDLDKVALCKEIQALQKTNPEAAKKKMEENGLNSSHVAYIPNRGNKPDKDTMELNAMYVAGFVFLSAPYEMFSDNALNIRASTDYPTVIATCAGGGFGYFATEEAYDYQSYESIIGYFDKGCAEAAEAQYIQMIKDLG